MPNRVRPQTIAIRNQVISDLEAIYGSEWREIAPEIDLMIEDMYLPVEESTQRDRLKYAEKDGKKNKLIMLIVAAAVLSNTKSIKRINSGMDKIYKVNANDVSKYVYSKTGIEIIKKGVDVKKLLGKYTKKRYDNATDSKYVKREILGEINKMLKEGKGTKKISQRLQKVYNFNKTSANRTTLTETTRIQNRGRFDVMKETERRGMKFKKIWRHGIHIAKPRDWHVSMDGEERDLDEPFSNGLMMPGEAGASAEEVINCHCWLDEELVDW